MGDEAYGGWNHL